MKVGALKEILISFDNNMDITFGADKTPIKHFVSDKRDNTLVLCSSDNFTAALKACGKLPEDK